MNENKLDKLLSVLIEGIDAKELWHLVFNKMTNPAKRQMIGELLNIYLGSGYSTQSSIFKKEQDDDNSDLLYNENGIKIYRGKTMTYDEYGNLHEGE